MHTLTVIGSIIGFLIYCIIAWTMGNDFKKQKLVNTQLDNIKFNLKKGESLNEKWHLAKRKSKSTRNIYIIVSIVILIGINLTLIIIDLRWFSILMINVVLVSPVWMGYEGIVPIPGISIDN